MYRLVINQDGEYNLMSFKAGVGASLRSGTISYVAGTQLGLSVTGGATATLKIWYNGIQIGADVTDSSSPITTGSPGFAYSSSLGSDVTNGDDWDAGTVP
jgi:hypothetical protein